MKKTSKKISLNKKSLVKLTDNQMNNINAAGPWYSKFICPSTKFTTCPSSLDLVCGTKTVA